MASHVFVEMETIIYGILLYFIKHTKHLQYLKALFAQWLYQLVTHTADIYQMCKTIYVNCCTVYL